MCGLCGIVSLNREPLRQPERIHNGLKAIAHRGPDHQGVIIRDTIALAHARLSVIDLSEGANQPLQSEDGKTVIIHNGEIFNFKQLRTGLQSRGVRFTTGSDTEVILHAYLHRGREAFADFDGFFATFIYDQTCDTWVLARDPGGVKPLYYTISDGLLLFSSEMKGLLAMGVARSPDMDSLFSYLQLSYIPQPWTAIQGVRQLRRGHCLVPDGEGKVKEIPYGKIEASAEEQLPSGAGANQHAGHFRELLGKAVEKRLISDVPAGAFLSGGLDSAAVVAEASRLQAGFSTYTIGFRDHPRYDESRFAEQLARHFQTKHTTIQLREEDMLDVVPAVLEQLDEPFGDSSAIAVFILSREVRKHVKVALSGDGGDELLGGYNKHKAEWLVRQLPLLPGLLKHLPFTSIQGNRHKGGGNFFRQLKRLLEGGSMEASARYWHWASFIPEAAASAWLHPDISLPRYHGRKASLLESIRRNPNDMNQVLSLDREIVLQGDMLVKADRMSMAHALEIRSPFLDRDLLSFCEMLPARYKVNVGSGKLILREAYRSILPADTLYRRKQGFEVPLYSWLNGPLKQPYLDKYFADDFVRAQGVFKPEAIRTLLSRLASSRPGDAAMQVWILLVFQYWWEHYISSS